MEMSTAGNISRTNPTATVITSGPASKSTWANSRKGCGQATDVGWDPTGSNSRGSTEMTSATATGFISGPMETSTRGSSSRMSEMGWAGCAGTMARSMWGSGETDYSTEQVRSRSSSDPQVCIKSFYSIGAIRSSRNSLFLARSSAKG